MQIEIVISIITQIIKFPQPENLWFTSYYARFGQTQILSLWIYDSFWKFKYELPNKEKFYSSLSGSKIIHKEYQHVLKVCNKFEIKTIKDYHDLYLKRDVFN